MLHLHHVRLAALAASLALAAACGGGGDDLDVTALALSAVPEEAVVGATQQFSAAATLADGTTRDLTARVTWTSSDPAIVSISTDAASAGLATIHAAGAVVIGARFGAVRAEREAGVFCRYPSFPNALRFGNVVPPLAWDGAYRGDGTRFDFDLRDVYCSDEYASTRAIIFVVGAGWCSACTLYTRRLDQQAREIEEAGGLIVYVEAQTANYGPASSEYAYQHLGRLISSGIGIRVGDQDTKPQGNYVYNSDIVTSFPTVFVVRRSDMKLIANRSRSEYELPLLDIVRSPDADWSNPGPPVFRSRCEAGDEEGSEPNDTAERAAALEPGTHTGGICTAAPDFYRVAIEGTWQFTLEFSHGVGDLDVHVWDATDDLPLQVEGEPVGSSSTTDRETFSFAGPALVRVYGYQGASAPYRLTLTSP